MRTSILFALLAVSLTAVLAAPHQSQVSVHRIKAHHQLKHLALPKFAVTPKSPIGDLIELIGLIIGIDVNAVIEQAGLTLQEIEAALNDAAIQLAEVTARVDEELAVEVEALINSAIAEALEILQPLLDVLAPLIPDASGKRALAAIPHGLIDELLKLLLGVTLEELVALAEQTVVDLEALAGRTLAAIDEIALRLSQELQAEIDRITAEAEARISAAIAPLLELLKPILPPAGSHPVAPLIDLPGLIQLVSEAVAAIDAAVAKADAALLELLQGSHLLDDINAILAAADAAIAETISAALQRALTTPIDQLPALVSETVEKVQGLINNAVVEVQLIIADQTPGLISDIQVISLQLITEIQDALQPLIDLITPPESHKAIASRRATLPELIQLIGVAIDDVKAAVTAASASLETLLNGTHIIEDVLELVVAAEKDALALIEQAVADALKSTIEELPALLERLVQDLQAQLTVVIAEIQSLVGREAEELLVGLDAIVAQLAADVAAAIQPILDALKPESH